MHLPRPIVPLALAAALAARSAASIAASEISYASQPSLATYTSYVLPRP